MEQLAVGSVTACFVWALGAVFGVAPSFERVGYRIEIVGSELNHGFSKKEPGFGERGWFSSELVQF
jgi:hypothetical protein